MTGKRKKTPAKFEFRGFINVSFSYEEQQAIISHLENVPADVEDCLVVMAEAEYKVGIAYDLPGDVYIFTATCKRPESPYYGYCFSFRHVDMARGLAIFRWYYASRLEDDGMIIAGDSNRPEW